MRLVLLLRGINVGGIKVPMAELRATLAGLGLGDVRTVLNTGNVLLSSDEEAAALKPRIEAALAERFRYEAFVLLFGADEVAAIAAGFPFPRSAERHAYVVFCADAETAAAVATPARERFDPAVEDVAVGTGAAARAVFWTVPKGASIDTAFAKELARPRLKSVTTVRNLNTVEKLL